MRTFKTVQSSASTTPLPPFRSDLVFVIDGFNVYHSLVDASKQLGLPDEMAVVEGGAGEETVSVALVTAGVGDTVLVHASEAIAVIGR